MSACAADFYLPGSTVPEVFLEADRQMNARNRKEKTITEPKVVKMPFIHGTPGVEGPLVVTEDWYIKEEKKRLAKNAKTKKEMQVEMMRLIAQRDRLNIKLGQLDPGKKKDSKKIVYINIKLKDIDAELKMLQEQSHINLDELDHGTKFSRYVGYFKRKLHQIGKKIKKFYHKYEEPITALITVAIPMVIAGVVRMLISLLV